MTYRDRRLARAERLRDWSSSRRQKSAAAFESARRIADAIPFGQPILVGHHSERHARRDQARIHSGMSRGIEHQDKAASMSSRAAEIERQAEHAIYSDDRDAVERLRERIAELEGQRETMKARNATFRQEHRAELKAMAGAYERDLAMPHQGYELQNLGGNITRQRKRLAELTGGFVEGAARPATAAAGETATARAGLAIVATMTTPRRAGKSPRPVWNVTGNAAAWRELLERLGASWWKGTCSFWEDPTADVEAALLADEAAKTGEEAPTSVETGPNID